MISFLCVWVSAYRHTFNAYCVRNWKKNTDFNKLFHIVSQVFSWNWSVLMFEGLKLKSKRNLISPFDLLSSIFYQKRLKFSQGMVSPRSFQSHQLSRIFILVDFFVFCSIKVIHLLCSKLKQSAFQCLLICWVIFHFFFLENCLWIIS